MRVIGPILRDHFWYNPVQRRRSGRTKGRSSSPATVATVYIDGHRHATARPSAGSNIAASTTFRLCGHCVSNRASKSRSCDISTGHQRSIRWRSRGCGRSLETAGCVPWFQSLTKSIKSRKRWFLCVSLILTKLQQTRCTDCHSCICQSTTIFADAELPAHRQCAYNAGHLRSPVRPRLRRLANLHTGRVSQRMELDR